MMEFFNNPLVAMFILAPLGMGITFATNILLTKARKRRAYHRLLHDPFVFVGAEMIRVKGPGDVPVIDAKCKIHKLSFGRMEVLVEDEESDEDGCIYTFTGLEFEGLIPVFKTGI